MKDESELYRISLDGDWELDDLYKFPRNFEQVYFGYLSLYKPEDAMDQDRADFAYSLYPWKGGYSAVNFYNQLKYSVKKSDRPEIVSMHYASPGWLELSLVQEVALNVGTVVSSVCGSLLLMNKTYSSIYKGMQERKLTKIKIEGEEFSLAKEHVHFLQQANEEMFSILNVPNAKEFVEKSENELRSLKILLSLYRRVRSLAEFQESGKAVLPSKSSEADR